MAITLTLYSFKKRENSTKRPSTGGTDFSVVLLDETSLMTPTFKLSIGSNPIGYNYAYVSDFNRYYFINDISSYQGYWYISCTCDVLASFKTELGAETHYVTRSAQSWDTYLTDMMYPAKSIQSGDLNSQTGSDPLDWSYGKSFILGVVGLTPVNQSDTQIGSVTYYHMDQTAFKTYMDFLMNTIDGPNGWSDLSGEYSVGVQQALLNPMQYIVSCKAVPIPPPSTLVVDTVKFGYYDVTIDGGQMDVIELNDNSTHTHTGFLRNESFSVALAKHPQATSRGKYLNGAPYSSYTLHFGPFGDIPLDPAALIDCTRITGQLLIDLISGQGRLMVFGSENPDAVLFNGSAQVATDINISQISNNMYSSRNKYWSELVGTMAGVAATNPVAGLAKAFEGGISMSETAAAYRFPTVSGSGSAGTFLSFFDDYNIYITAKFIELVDENLAELGRPLNQNKQINTLSGYILCQNAECQITGTADESDRINGFLNGGFFYE